ncbi:hypothetical protein GF377_01565, partial [candidate division GN15 bacterium]|nr:hypothetical protein [candidate division GN15 bacterium]
MEVTAVVNGLHEVAAGVSARPRPDQPLDDYACRTPEELLRILRTMLVSRRLEFEEKLLLRRGHNKFFIGAGGKELADAVLADCSRDNDPWLGYYRNKAFEIHRGSTIREKLMEALGDARVANNGQLQAHAGYPERSIVPQISVTGAHALEAAAIAEALKHPVPVSEQSWQPGGTWPEDAVVMCCMGDGATSEAEFNRAVFNAVHLKSPVLFAIYNCGWAISVCSEEQFIAGDLTVPLKGFTEHGLKVIDTDGTDIKALIPAVEEALEYARTHSLPVLMNIKVTREN